MREGYKETSVGIIPEDWELFKASEIFENISIKNNENEELLSATQENGVIPRSMLEGRVVMPESSTNGYKLVDKGDFVISLRTFQGGIEYSNYRGLVSPAYTVLRNSKPIVHNMYRFLFKKDDFISRLSSSVIGIRDGKQISYKQFSQQYIQYPPLPEQEKIASILTTVDDKIESIDKQIELATELKKGLMQKLFQEGIGHTEFKDSPVGQIPVEWEVKKLNDATELIKDGTHSTHIDVPDGIPLLSAKDIRNNEVHIPEDCRKISQEDFNKIHSRFKLKVSDLLITIVGTIGRTSIIRKYNNDFTFQRSVAYIRMSSKFNHLFINQYFNSSSFKNELKLRSSVNAQPGIYLGELAKIFIPEPSLEEQKQIVDILTCADDKISVLKYKKEAYTVLKKGLMQKLLTGEVRVQVDA